MVLMMNIRPNVTTEFDGKAKAKILEAFQPADYDAVVDLSNTNRINWSSKFIMDASSPLNNLRLE